MVQMSKSGWVVKLFKLPMLVALLFMGAMYGVGEYLDPYRYSFGSQALVSALIFVSGVIMVALGGRSFRRAKTTVNPLTPHKSTQLVTTSVYRLSRNPMYVGFVLWLVACAVFVGSWVNLGLIALYIVLTDRLHIVPEERALGELFGQKYEIYKQRVRRWL